MSSVGEELKRARLEQALDLETVAARTKIPVRFLAAIEADDRKRLPSGFFYKSFVDQYARLLSLDLKAIHSEVDLLLSQDAPLPLPGQESPMTRNVPPIKVARDFRVGKAFASLAVLAGVVAGCSAVYTWWHAALLSKKANSTVAMTARRVSSPIAPAPSVKAEAAVPISATVEATSKVLLDLKAHEATWLSVTSGGKRVFSGILAAHQSKTVEGKDSATMKVGNAAGLEVRLNGKLLGPLGARGQVLRVVFTPNDYQIVPPSPREGD
jgi:cytoskeletal protein RodZ